MKETQLPWTKFLAAQWEKSSGKADPGYLEHANNQNKVLSALYMGSSFNKHDDKASTIKPYQVGEIERTVLDITESKDSNEQMMLLISDKKGIVFDNMKAMRDNILDLNICPVNVHALYRQIPFLGIHTYAYNTEAHLFNHLNKRYTTGAPALDDPERLKRVTLDFNSMKIKDKYAMSTSLVTVDAVDAKQGVKGGHGAHAIAEYKQVLDNSAYRLFHNCSTSDKIDGDTPSLQVGDAYFNNIMMGKHADKGYKFSKEMKPYLLMAEDTVVDIAFTTAPAVANYANHPIGNDHTAAAAAPKTYTNVLAIAGGARSQEGKTELLTELASRVDCHAMKYILFNDTLYEAMIKLLEDKLKMEENLDGDVLTSAAILQAEL
jgi:hypothetical protein